MTSGKVAIPDRRVDQEPRRVAGPSHGREVSPPLVETGAEASLPLAKGRRPSKNAADIRELRRIGLLARRVASDWGGAHPEFGEIATTIDRLLVKESAEKPDIEPLIHQIEKARAKHSDGAMYDVVRRDLLAELAELDAHASEN